MVKEVIWSPLAIESFDGIVAYLMNKFGDATVQKFIALVNTKIELLKVRPKMFRRSQTKKNTYITNIHKKVTLTYRFRPQKKQLELVVFWGMQDPQKKPL